MEYLTIKEFAKLHNVTRHAIQAAIHSGRLKNKKKLGVYVVSEKAKYKPVIGRGRKNKKTQDGETE